MEINGITMNYLSSNIKYLRKKNRENQEDLAGILGVSRTTVGDYERGKTEPSIEALLCMASHYCVDVGRLISQDLSLDELEVGHNDDLRILAISVDSENRENIELVDTKAEAGYLDSFSDPEYIRDLPKISIPSFPEGTFRGFEISGNSMLPIAPGSIIICSYVERLADIKDGQTYIIVSANRGLVYKRVYKSGNKDSLILSSDNPAYPPYEIDFSEVREVWKYYAHISFEDSQSSVESLIRERLDDLYKKLDAISQKLEN